MLSLFYILRIVRWSIQASGIARAFCLIAVNFFTKIRLLALSELDTWIHQNLKKTSTDT